MHWQGGNEDEAADRRSAWVVMPRSVVMEEDYPSRHQEKKIPILDMEMWIEGNVILHQHYAKPMACRSVVMAKSVFPSSIKKNILLEEGARRLRN